jgi:signal transduction histidine kinase
VRRRLTLAIVGVATGAVVLFAVPLALVLRSSYRDEELARLQRDTLAATRSIDVSGGRDTVELPRSSDVLAVYDRRGLRVAGRGPQRAGALVERALTRGRAADSARSGTLAVAVPLVSGERVDGAVRAQRSDAHVERRVHRAWLALAGLAAALVAIAALAAWALGRRLARPLDDLAAAAERLGEGDFSTAFPRSGVEELDTLSRALSGTARRLEALVSRERTFTAGASHQMRTPLAALRIELEAAELRGDAPAEVPAAIAEVDRLEATIDTLLSVARRRDRGDARADLASLLDQAEQRWRGPLAQDGRPLRIEMPPGRPQAAAGPRVVGEILEVLLDNARIHGAGPVTLRVADLGAAWAVEVSDEGPGFGEAPEAAFAQRSPAASETGRHGIGLALARSLAHAEDGRLEVLGGIAGATVRLTLRKAPPAVH